MDAVKNILIKPFIFGLVELKVSINYDYSIPLELLIRLIHVLKFYSYDLLKVHLDTLHNIHLKNISSKTNILLCSFIQNNFLP